MSYEFYKILHYLSILTMVSMAACNFLSNDQSKLTKILTGVFSLLLLVSGMGLLARVGVSHGSGFPAWVNIKLGVWLLLAAGIPILNKRVQNKRRPVFFGLLFLVFIALYSAVTKLA